MATLLYGCGFRLMECVRLRVHDIDFDRNQITVRDGKGMKDRAVMLPEQLKPFLRDQLEKVKVLHERDIKEGYGEVYLPFALEKNTNLLPKNRAGNMCFRPNGYPTTPEAVSCGAIMLMKAVFRKRSGPPPAKPD